MDNTHFAKYFDIPQQVMPYLPELLAASWALGSSPELIVDWLRDLDLPSCETRVLDLGCGKGAVCITIAEELQFTTYGIDFFEPCLVLQ